MLYSRMLAKGYSKRAAGVVMAAWVARLFYAGVFRSRRMPSYIPNMMAALGTVRRR